MSKKRGRGAMTVRGRGSYVGDVRRRSDWVVGGTFINAAGVAVSGPTYGALSSYSIGPSFAYAHQVVGLTPVAGALNAPPSIGQVAVEEIQGSFFLSNPTIAGVYIIGVGIYISKYNTITGTWDMRFPSGTAAEGQRDDWLYLKPLVVQMPLAATYTGPIMLEIPLHLPRRVVIGGGEALHVGIDCSSAPLASSITVNPYFRGRISVIA